MIRANQLNKLRSMTALKGLKRRIQSKNQSFHQNSVSIHQKIHRREKQTRKSKVEKINNKA